MPKVETNDNIESVREKRRRCDDALWSVVSDAAAQMIDDGDFETDVVVHVMTQYLRGMNQGVKAVDLRNLASESIEEARNA
jgi:hypothetical protein